MKYQIGQSVVVENKIKSIKDFELIENFKIYYMSDNTSYEESQIIYSKEDYEKSFSELKKQITSSLKNDIIEGFKVIKKEYMERNRKKKKSFFQIFFFNPKPTINKS